MTSAPLNSSDTFGHGIHRLWWASLIQSMGLQVVHLPCTHTHTLRVLKWTEEGRTRWWLLGDKLGLGLISDGGD